MASVTNMVFDSQTKTVSSTSYLDCKNEDDGYIRFNIASGYVDETVISFENERILVRLNARGEVTFSDANDQPLASASVPPSGEGRGCYLEVSCKVENDGIFVRFPEYVWYDNYPHCDGESDRWDAKIIGYKASVVFCLSTKMLKA